MGEREGERDRGKSEMKGGGGARGREIKERGGGSGNTGFISK